MLHFLLFTFAFCLSCVWQLFNKRIQWWWWWWSEDRRTE